MTDFTSSDGHIRIAYENDLADRIDIFSARGGENMLDGAPWLGRYEVSALREFFQHERDEELGRWRWPENPDYVVYLRNDGQACVFNEATGVTVYRFRGEHEHLEELRRQSGEEVMPHTHAARAYFEAHPERKPWHAPDAGDHWALHIAHGMALSGDEHLYKYTRWGSQGRWGFVPTDGGSVLDPTDPTITAGRRIWPEDAS